MITNKVNEYIHYYTLCGNDTTKTLQYVNVSRSTLIKYINIAKNLDFTLREHLDIKGRKKLSLGFAEYLIDNVQNPDHQVFIYPKIAGLTDKMKKESLNELIECPICCTSSCSQIELPCCSRFICIDCIYHYLDVTINDITFSGIRCPCCRSFFGRGFLRSILSRKGNYRDGLYWLRSSPRPNPIYNRNLYKKMFSIIRKVEAMNRRRINRNTLDFDELTRSNNPELYYGVCTGCCPTMSNYPINNFGSLKVSSVERRCVNGEGGIVVLKEEMFTCKACNGEEEVVFKKCPHCGIRTTRPDGCNYVICGDHRWCFICNERLEVNHEGHNIHYWMGAGSGPFSDECRQSRNHSGPKYILNHCDCLFCRRHEGMRLCKNIDCYERCSTEFCQKCSRLDTSGV